MSGTSSKRVVSFKKEAERGWKIYGLLNWRFHILMQLNCSGGSHGPSAECTKDEVNQARRAQCYKLGPNRALDFYIAFSSFFYFGRTKSINYVWWYLAMPFTVKIQTNFPRDQSTLKIGDPVITFSRNSGNIFCLILEAQTNYPIFVKFLDIQNMF